MQLTFDAVDVKGKPTHDVVEAHNAREAIEMLRRRGLFVTRISDDTSPIKKQVRTHAARELKLSTNHLALFTRQMAMLLKAGSGVVPAMNAIGRQMPKPSHKELLRRIASDLEDGNSLTETLCRYPASFDPVYCAIVAAGEASGSLGKMFERLAEIVGKRRALRKQIKSAFAYPVLLIAMCVKIIGVMLLFVLPRFGDMFTQLGVNPPTTTLMLLGLGKALHDYWYMLLFGILLFAAATTWLVLSSFGHQLISNLQTRIPGIGHLRAQMIQAQILRTMGMLLDSRVGLLETMELARKSTANRDFQNLFVDMAETVTTGGQVSTAMDRCRLLAPYVVQAVRTGEESGNLAGAMLYCADVLDESNTELLQTVMKLIEPAILIIMGLVVGGVAISLFLPLFDLTSAVQ